MLQAAHRGGSHVNLKPEETSAQHAGKVLCQMAWFKIDACQVDVFYGESLFPAHMVRKLRLFCKQSSYRLK